MNMDPYFDVKLVRSLQEEVILDEGQDCTYTVKYTVNGGKERSSKYKAKSKTEAEAKCKKAWGSKTKIVSTKLTEAGPMLGGPDGAIGKDGFGKLCPECYKLLADCTCVKEATVEPAVESKVNESAWFTKEKIAKLKARLEKVRGLYRRNPKNSEKHEREGVFIEDQIEELEKKLKGMKAPKEEVEEAIDNTQVDTPPVSKDNDNAAPGQAPGEVSGVKQSENDGPTKVTKVVPKVEGEVRNEAVETETEPATKPDTKPSPTKPKSPIAPQPNVTPKPKANHDVELFKKARA